ncbi:DUF1990 family protein [Streptomyces purpurogeneiscleroticus]|uniref:DUF1990 family protein n=1 Tax=Streptomyces purpurogeneiscleroticus TaxID=68259 RepID=UPI001CBF17AE|nr:DUF1990 domain-containing protein [Streptomyces purpurogeneiscleroticus]MBZ4020499.1 hypothetical protein [Streptomyces purpurogeneiscleroticus]
MTAALTYPEHGATQHGPLPAGYHHLHVEVPVGHGRAVFERAGEAITAFRMHRAAGIRIRAGAAHAEPGVPVESGLGVGPLRITAPCRVVWSTYDSDRIGFGYGTLEGHPECGEESFVAELRPDDSVWFTVTAFSRAASWYTRLAGPLIPVFQRAYARHCGRTLRKLVR